MLLYQALKCLSGSVRVTHALKDVKFWDEAAEDDSDYGSDYDSLNIGELQPPCELPTTIGTCIRWPTTLVDRGDEAGSGP